MRKPKYIFVSGGVISALVKGVTAASISLLLKRRGFRVCPIKCENNLNVDFGTINPIEHGDPFLCFDGLESDQDLGNYERFLGNVVGLNDTDSEELNPNAENLIVHSIPFNEKYQVIKGDGCSMRLGSFDCVLDEDSLIYEIYDKHDGFKDKKSRIVSERHRHRYEFNNKYREILQEHGLRISGTSPDDFFVEMIELPQDQHPFFIATQGHPEYKSKPLDPHPIFVEFIKAGIGD